jgi:hypothetical protein
MEKIGNLLGLRHVLSETLDSEELGRACGICDCFWMKDISRQDIFHREIHPFHLPAVAHKIRF